MYVICNRVLKYMRKKREIMRRETDKYTNTIRDFKTPPFSVTNRPIRQKITSDIDARKALPTNLIQCYICRTFHPTTEYTFFFNVHGAFTKKHHILGHNSNFNRFQIT